MMNIQLFGRDCPPFYSIQSITQKVEEISKIDEKINALLIEREELVTNLKEAIKKENTTESTN